MLLGDSYFSTQSKGIIPGVIDGSAANVPSNVLNPISLNNQTKVWFYKGALPTNAEMNTFTVASRAADCLLKFNSVLTSYDTTTKISFSSGNVLGTFVAEGATTWFAIGQLESANPSSAILFGSVGLLNSGSDLELFKVNIIAADIWLLRFNIILNSVLTQV